MPQTPQPPTGGANSRSLGDPIGQTGHGIPDEAVGPEESARPESLGLARDKTAEAMARKLAREAASWEARRRSQGDVGEA